MTNSWLMHSPYSPHTIFSSTHSHSPSPPTTHWSPIKCVRLSACLSVCLPGWPSGAIFPFNTFVIISPFFLQRRQKRGRRTVEVDAFRMTESRFALNTMTSWFTRVSRCFTKRHPYCRPIHSLAATSHVCLGPMEPAHLEQTATPLISPSRRCLSDSSSFSSPDLHSIKGVSFAPSASAQLQIKPRQAVLLLPCFRLHTRLDIILLDSGREDVDVHMDIIVFSPCSQ